MAIEIKTWQVTDAGLRPLETGLANHGRREAEHLETWIESEPSILGRDIVLIGRQVHAGSGRLDLLGIDKLGNTVVIELKRGRLPREVLTQAIDYASDVSTWSTERLSEVCEESQGKSLEEVLADSFDDVDLENLAINEGQRILLVGFGAERELERMVEWLSGTYDVNINAITMHYTRTAGGEELLTKTAVISEEKEQERVRRQRNRIPMSNQPGQYDRAELKDRLRNYLTSNRLLSAERIREGLLPACLKHNRVTRDALVEEFLDRGLADDHTKAGQYISLISVQMGLKRNDYLRQVIGYEYPDHHWKKDNYHIREGYQDLIREVLGDIAEAKGTRSG